MTKAAGGIVGRAMAENTHKIFIENQKWQRSDLRPLDLLI